jgi:hypothetical protein
VKPERDRADEKRGPDTLGSTEGVAMARARICEIVPDLQRLADLGTYDDSDLLAMLQAVHDADAELFASTAYDEDALAELIGSLQTLENAGRDTEPGEPPAVPVTKPGDLILLGEHRLLCGTAKL